MVRRSCLAALMLGSWILAGVACAAGGSSEKPSECAEDGDCPLITCDCAAGQVERLQICDVEDGIGTCMSPKNCALDFGICSDCHNFFDTICRSVPCDCPDGMHSASGCMTIEGNAVCLTSENCESVFGTCSGPH